MNSALVLECESKFVALCASAESTARPHQSDSMLHFRCASGEIQGQTHLSSEEAPSCACV